MKTAILLTALSTTVLVAPLSARQTVPGSAPVATRVAHMPGHDFISGSISPDGRWVLLSGWDADSEMAVWVTTTAGGTPRRLLENGGDSFAVFAPSGDRIFFRSRRVTRGDSEDAYLVSASFDPQTGRLNGDVRQVGLQPMSPGAPRVSPDGRWVAYISSERLIVVPAAGGTERALGRADQFRGAGGTLAWSADSRALSWRRELQDAAGAEHVHVDLNGTVLSRVPAAQVGGRLLPDGEHVVRVRQGPSDRDRTLVIARRGGDIVVETPFPDLTISQVSPDGRHLTAVKREKEASLRAVATTGGATRDVAPATGYNWAMGWTRTGDLVFDGDSMGMRVMSLGARNDRPFALPDLGARPTVLAALGEHVVVRMDRGSQGGMRPHMLVHVPSGRVDTLTAQGLGLLPTTGRGGAYGLDGQDILVVEQEDGQPQIRAVSLSGDSRVVRRFAPGFLNERGFAVHGDRVAYAEQQGDTLWLTVTDGPDAEPRRIVALPGTSTRLEIRWSHDGRRIAVTPGATHVHLVSLDAAPGQILRTVPLPFSYWYELMWLPDDAAVTMVADTRTSGVHIVRVDLDSGRTHILTQDDPRPKWGHLLSPDGRTAVYSAEVVKAGSVWIYDLSRMR